MRATRGFLLIGAVVIAVAGLSACGERDQVTVYKQGKYQGKPDTQPWNTAPTASLHTSSNWTTGDKSSWESALRTRNQTQNEYTRAE